MQRCSYCGAERPESEMIHQIIYYRTQGWQKPRFGLQKWGQILTTKKQWYCKDKGCAGHDQMAQED